MKNILLATTALVAFAGVASAQDLGVTLSGSAEMGIAGGSRYDTAADATATPPVEAVDAETQFVTDLDVTFTMSGVADNGLTFGATVDLDEAADTNNVGVFEDASKQGGENMFVSFGGATVTMGDTDGAYDKRMKEVALVGGSLMDDETEHQGYSGNSGLDGKGGDGQIARFDYSFNTFGVSLSLEQDDDGNGDNPVIGFGASYDAEMAGLNIGLGLGYQSQEELANILGLSVYTKFANGLSAAVNFSRTDFDASGAENQTHAAIGFGYEMNQMSFGINYGKFSNVGGVDGAEQSGYGLVANYDLGGGLVAQLGYGSGVSDVATDKDSFSAGLSMSF
ncbi:porin [Puniceibacterium sediminis]|uniref:Outer membrane protein OmpU n=1 Tax=Puniceibacterium sediminis TaxID=1608407 RepID=A0A238Y3Q1_9RHOB|nr:porin [Puniceibacterium sediminis]SNR65602.1 outer membrane protein OmpU [Puniceibacterium sediminis]